MNLVEQIEQYNNNNIFFSDPIKNNIINDGYFIRILYSTHHMTLNGIYLLVGLRDVYCEKYYSKFKCGFNVANHSTIIESLKCIEEGLLKKYNSPKIPYYKIYEQLKSGYIKVFDDIGTKSNCLFILKISGIWETHTNYGLTYKFIKTDPLFP